VTAPAELVVLVADDGTPIGTADKATVHSATTPLHLAFSCYLFDSEDRLLLTRRALSKKTWPGVWTNTCCGHPGPGESSEDATRRRLRDELGITVGELKPVLPKFRYRAVAADGMVENEICPVYFATVDADPEVDPEEVMDWAWIDRRAFVAAITAAPIAFSPWAVDQVSELVAGRHL
jgi:isopentenyl-diphosphate delta-isomerase